MKKEDIIVIKRDGKRVGFDQEKIITAISKAAAEVGTDISKSLLRGIVSNIRDYAYDGGQNQISIQEIQKLVEDSLMIHGCHDVARAYIIYRSEHDKARKSIDGLMSVYQDLTFAKSTDMNLKRDNANVNTDAPMGVMLKYGTTGSNYFVDHYMLPKEFTQAHQNGDIHVHDKDFYPLTFNCCQIDIGRLFKGGFDTGHGHLREPQEIRSYASLACIAIQANQNDMFGGQSINAFDYAMAPGVRKTFIKKMVETLEDLFSTFIIDGELGIVDHYVTAVKENNCFGLSYSNLERFGELKEFTYGYFGADNVDDKEELDVLLESSYKSAMRKTKKETHQAMEAVVHNLNSMHSRAGAQVPFSSINFGTDMSPEGILVSEQLLLAQESGLGNGETPIFPILVFKMKEGLNFNPGDPGYDLFKLSIRVSAKRLFPNFVNIDAPFNLQYYKPGHPETEIAAMGCRTRVIGNDYDKTREQSASRGNIAFVSINLPKLALNSGKDEKKFFSDFDRVIDIAKRQLLHRFDILRKKHVYNFPFLMGEGVWLDSEKLKPDDTIGEVLKHGSLSIGFVGLAEALVALTGEHHGQSESAQKLGLKIIKHLRKRTDKFTQETGLNFSTFATPAESLAGRFAKINRQLFGTIEGVTDRDYLTNSFHENLNVA